MSHPGVIGALSCFHANLLWAVHLPTLAIMPIQAILRILPFPANLESSQGLGTV
jgi:hypothetical protein